MSTTDTLEDARRDLQTARDCVDDPHRRRQYSLAAMDLAATVLLSHDVTPEQRRYAGEYLAAVASAMSGRSSPASGGFPGMQRSPHHHEPAPGKADTVAAEAGLQR